MNQRTSVLNKLRDVAGKLQLVQKEIMSMNVPGLELTREDLGVRRPKKNKDFRFEHGQKHYQPKLNNGITTPGDGQGQYPQGTTPEILHRR